MSKKENLVSVIIVSYNTCELTLETLRTFYKSNRFSSCEVLVVDNNSSDETEKKIKNQFKDVIFIQTGSNLGFGKANNLGVKYAKGDFLLFLNSDTIVNSSICEEFLIQYDSFQNESILGARIFDLDMNPNTSFCRTFPGAKQELNNLGALFHSQVGMYFNTTDKPLFLEGPVSGACFFMKKSLFESLGGFDPDFFLYYEETDLFLRAAKKGVSIIALDTPSLIHLEGGSETVKEVTLERSFVSKALYFEKNIGTYEACLTKLLFKLNAYLRIAIFALKKDKVKVDFWKLLVKLENRYL